MNESRSDIDKTFANVDKTCLGKSQALKFLFSTMTGISHKATTLV